MSNQLDWEACRYVLDDPTLDRQAFELRMLDDVELALAVARAMSDINLLRAASQRDGVVANEVRRATSGWHWTSLAALAATLLLSVGLFSYSLRQRSIRDTTLAMASHEQSLAGSWLAIRQTELVDTSSNLLVDISSTASIEHNEVDLPRDEASSDAAELISTAVGADEQDWLIDAAREFYAQGAAG